MSAYNPSQPRETVFREAAVNVEFRQRELQEPALLYMQTRGAELQQEERPLKRDNTWMDKGPTDVSKEVCHNWNRGKCTNNKCPRMHVCSTCRNGSHKAVDCKEIGDKGSKKGRPWRLNPKKGGKGKGQ